MNAPAVTLPKTRVRVGAVGEVRRGGWLVRIAIVVIVVLWSVPTIGLLITSLRPEDAVNSSGWWTVLANPLRSAAWTFENYQLALDAGGFANAFLNSLALTLPSTVIPITIAAFAAFAAYAFLWMEFRGRYVLFLLVVGLLVVPLQMAMIPILRLYTNGATLFGLQIVPDLDLNESFLGIWLAHTGFGLPLATYLLRNYIGSLPSSIIESAKMDGADHFTIFWRLIVPLSIPALAASRSSSSCGCGTTCSWPMCSSEALVRTGCSPSRCATSWAHEVRTGTC